MRCKDAMVTMVFRCRGEDPVQKVAQLMQEMRIGFIPVTDESGGLVGVVTDRDLAVRVLAEGKSPRTPVGWVMTRGPMFTCHPDDDLREVERRMVEEQRKRAVVVANDKVVGVLSVVDIAVGEGAGRRTGKLMHGLSRHESISHLVT